MRVFVLAHIKREVNLRGFYPFYASEVIFTYEIEAGAGSERYIALYTFEEVDVSREQFGETIKVLRKKYCDLLKTDQLTILVPKKEVTYSGH